LQILEYSIEILHNVIIRITNDSKTDGLKISVTTSVLLSLFTISMTITVDFDDERLFRTIEVHDMRTDAMLPTELDPLQLPRSQSRPQSLLRPSHIGAKSAFEIEMACLSSCGGSGHVALPLLASPYKGEEN
jgi:hypothetical protein